MYAWSWFNQKKLKFRRDKIHSSEINHSFSHFFYLHSTKSPTRPCFSFQISPLHPSPNPNPAISATAHGGALTTLALSSPLRATPASLYHTDAAKQPPTPQSYPATSLDTVIIDTLDLIKDGRYVEVLSPIPQGTSLDSKISCMSFLTIPSIASTGSKLS